MGPAGLPEGPKRAPRGVREGSMRRAPYIRLIGPIGILGLTGRIGTSARGKVLLPLGPPWAHRAHMAFVANV
eukprot:2375014-Pyramimonas_sp.AAC.1